MSASCAFCGPVPIEQLVLLEKNPTLLACKDPVACRDRQRLNRRNSFAGRIA